MYNVSVQNKRNMIDNLLQVILEKQVSMTHSYEILYILWIEVFIFYCLQRYSSCLVHMYMYMKNYGMHIFIILHI